MYTLTFDMLLHTKGQASDRAPARDAGGTGQVRQLRGWHTSSERFIEVAAAAAVWMAAGLAGRWTWQHRLPAQTSCHHVSQNVVSMKGDDNATCRALSLLSRSVYVARHAQLSLGSGGNVRALHWCLTPQ